MRRLILFVIGILSSSSLYSQEINNYSALFDVRDSSYTRICYDNDLFRGTDRFYTQGIGIDVFSSGLKRNPVNIVLLRLKNSDRDRFGIEFRTHGCTPSTILSDSVLIGDRPYAGVFSIGSVRTSQLVERKLRLTSQLEIGVIGEAAFGEETQTGIHRITGSDLPLGWQHQIKNAPIVNYTLRLEKGTPVQIPSILNSTVNTQAKFGTFQTNVSAGIDFSLGRRNHPFSDTKHRFEYYVYSQSAVLLVAYDASLMGGIANRDGYHLLYSEMNPLVLKQHVGFVFAVPHFSIALDFAFISKEIKVGVPHSWGGLRLTIY
ncbi:MAG: lipid A deacylase LpxR family protein [Crocinitomicaceae bacterium]|nr:lipid A deacylase LpxR family protein [Flavobacteriales bacterium]NQZ35029.1 lipid A deacylase LpxR family protein [Crocinitomicaceae bacterium]